MHPYVQMMRDVRAVADAKARAVEVALAHQSAQELFVGAFGIACGVYAAGAILYVALEMREK